jgi:cytoskeletal protein CcmA (bactofilin family)
MYLPTTFNTKKMWNSDKKNQEEHNLASSISVFAAGLKLKGDVDAPNDIRIDGFMEGNISSGRKVMIGASGQLKGNIRAEEVHVMGEMKGDLYAKGLAKVGATGKFNGSIISAQIEIEQGADVEASLTKIRPVKEIKKEDGINLLDKIKELGPNHSKTIPKESPE